MSGFYYLSRIKKLKFIQILVLALGIIILFSTMNRTKERIGRQREISRNMKGDELYGMTPDWKNYIKMSRWTAQNIPKTERIAVRKPNISFVFAEREFYGLYKLPSQDPDSLMNFIKDREIRYIIMGS